MALQRRRLWKVHRWLGWTLGIVIAFQGLTGAAIVFKDEWERAAHPEMFGPLTSGGWLPPEVLIETTQEQYSGRGTLTRFDMPLREGEAATAHITLANNDHATVAVDPVNGHVFSPRIWEKGLVGVVYDLHNLFYFGSAGYRASGVFGFAFLGSVLLGVAITWPGPDRWRSTFFKPQQMLSPSVALRFNHRRLGLIVAPLLLLSIVTGIWMSLGDLARPRLAEWSLVDGRIDQPPRGKGVGVRVADAVAAARAVEHGQPISSVAMPDENQSFTVSFVGRGGDIHAEDRVVIDAANAQVLATIRASELRALDQFWQRWLYQIHNGEAFGISHRLLLLGVGVTPLVLLMFALASRSTWRHENIPRR